VRIQIDSRLSGLISWFRSGLSGFLGLLSLIVLSILFVWPLWYLATSHTHLYSLAMMVLAGGSLGFMVFARMRKVFRKTGRNGLSRAKAEIQQPDPAEHAE